MSPKPGGGSTAAWAAYAPKRRPQTLRQPPKRHSRMPLVVAGKVPANFSCGRYVLWSDARSEKRGTHIDRHLTSHSCRTSFRIVSGGPMGSKRLQKNRSCGFLRGFWPFSRRGSPYAAALFMMRSSAARAHDGDSVFSRGCPRAELRADQN